MSRVLKIRKSQKSIWTDLSWTRNPRWRLLKAYRIIAPGIIRKFATNALKTRTFISISIKTNRKRFQNTPKTSSFIRLPLIRMTSSTRASARASAIRIWFPEIAGHIQIIASCQTILACSKTKRVSQTKMRLLFPTSNLIICFKSNLLKTRSTATRNPSFKTSWVNSSNRIRVLKSQNLILLKIIKYFFSINNSYWKKKLKIKPPST